jgi:hypothetical protein
LFDVFISWDSVPPFLGSKGFHNNNLNTVTDNKTLSKIVEWSTILNNTAYKFDLYCFILWCIVERARAILSDSINSTKLSMSFKVQERFQASRLTAAALKALADKLEAELVSAGHAQGSLQLHHSDSWLQLQQDLNAGYKYTPQGPLEQSRIHNKIIIDSNYATIFDSGSMLLHIVKIQQYNTKCNNTC